MNMKATDLPGRSASSPGGVLERARTASGVASTSPCRPSWAQQIRAGGVSIELDRPNVVHESTSRQPTHLARAQLLGQFVEIEQPLTAGVTLLGVPHLVAQFYE